MGNPEFGRPPKFIQDSLSEMQRQMNARTSTRERSNFVERKLWEMGEIAGELNVPIIYKDVQGSTRKILPVSQKPPANADNKLFF